MVPSADPTVPPEGHAADAAVVAGIVTVAVAVAVGVAAAAVGVAVDPVPALPHAPRAAAHAKVVRGIQRELLRVTCNASVNYVPALGLRLVHYEPSRCHFEEAMRMSDDADHPDHADPVPGPQGSNEEPQAHLTTTPRGGGWRMFPAPVEVEAYLAQVWAPALVRRGRRRDRRDMGALATTGPYRRGHPPPGDRRLALPSAQGRIPGRLTPRFPRRGSVRGR